MVDNSKSSTHINKIADASTPFATNYRDSKSGKDTASMNNYSDTVPRERLRIFISSAQNDENDFSWSDVRRKIKETLNGCPFFSPFIIEDSPSEIPSLQRFIFQVQKADIVVLLLKDELRKGTQAEFATATKYKKPMMVYFLGGKEESKEVAQIREKISEWDYCTYYGSYKAVDGLEQAVFKHLMENVIEYYQYKHMTLNSEDISVSTATVETESARSNVPTSASLSLFDGCYNHIFDLLILGYLKQDNTKKTDGALKQLGINALDWLIDGKKINNDAGVLALIAASQDIYICLEKLFPLCIEILKSLAPMPTKEQCITALCDLLAYYKANKIVIPEKLVDAISHFDPASTPNLHFVERVSTGTLSCKTLLLKLIVGLLGKEELIKWCISYSKKEVNERVALSNCIETFLRYAEDINDQSDVIILAIVLQCFEDEDASIRRAACTCLSYLLKTQHRVLVKNKLYEATLDASHTVRLRLLQLCNSGAITDSDVVDHIMNILSRDAYYIIRQELKASI